MARKKQPALDVPATDQEAAALLAEYVATDRGIMQQKLAAEIAIDKIKAHRDDYVAILTSINATRFAAIKVWWEAGGNAIAAGSRSADVAGAKLGLRKTPPSLKLSRGTKAEVVIAWLRKSAWSRARAFLRIKYELDKPALIKAIQTMPDDRARLAENGLSVEQIDEFFIDTGLDADAMRAAIRSAAGQPTT